MNAWRGHRRIATQATIISPRRGGDKAGSQKLEAGRARLCITGSTDGTRTICESFPNVRVVVRPFDNHATQWNFGLEETGIASEWVLALDADYVLTDAFTDELRSLMPAQSMIEMRRGYQPRRLESAMPLAALGSLAMRASIVEDLLPIRSEVSPWRRVVMCRVGSSSVNRRPRRRS